MDAYGVYELKDGQWTLLTTTDELEIALQTAYHLNDVNEGMFAVNPNEK